MKNKHFLTVYFFLLLSLLSNILLSAQCDDLVITAVFDGPLNSEPRGVELYAKKAIPDLSIYGIGSATNGGGSDGVEFTFPTKNIAEGTFIYVADDSTAFHNYFGFAADFIPATNAAVGFLNGDDAVELFCNNAVTDVFGQITHSGSGLAWNYQDGWAYRLSGTGPDGTTFVPQNWRTARNALDNTTTNATAENPILIGTYDTFSACDRIIITGVYDGPLPGGEPQGVELYVTRAISDLSLFGFGSITNGNGSNGIEFNFPKGKVAANTFLYLTTDSTDFHTFFGFAPNMISTTATINGDDAVELFCQQGTPTVIDVFGDINQDGTGQPWEYTDGWAARKSGTGPEGTTFTVSNWNYGGVNALEGGTTNATVSTPYPIGTYRQTDNDCPKVRNIPTGDLASGTYRAEDTLLAEATIPNGGMVNFTAGKMILLKSGFQANTGSEFSAKIENCPTTLSENNVAVNFKNVQHQDSFSKIEKSNLGLTVYPNPTSTQLSINLTLAEKNQVQIQLFNQGGDLNRVLLSKQTLDSGVQRFDFETSTLPAGLYWLQVIREHQRLIEKVVVIK